MQWKRTSEPEQSTKAVGRDASSCDEADIEKGFIFSPNDVDSFVANELASINQSIADLKLRLASAKRRLTPADELKLLNDHIRGKV